MDLKEFLKLKKQLEQWQRDKDRASGVLGQLTTTLQKEFLCNNLKQAKRLLKKLERKEHEQEQEANRALKKLEQDRHLQRRGNRRSD